MSPLRILHVIFSSRIAGAERYCVDLANRQAAMGHEVHVVGMRASPVAGALHRNVCYHGFNSRFFRGIFLRRLVRRISADICHGHLSPACKALAGTPVDVTKVATLHVGYKPHQHAKLDGLICVNGVQATRLYHYRGLMRIIPNWLPQAPTDISGLSLRAELGLTADCFLIGAVGRLHMSKGMDVLISAFRAAATARSVLAIIGEGPQRSRLKRLCGGDQRIHLLGFRDNVYGCLRDLDLFISPSREESFGLAILEAMTTGVPIIATAAEGPAEFLIDQPVELVPPDSVQSLTTSIRGAYDRFRSKGLPRIEYDLESFDPAVGVACVTNFYLQVIAAKSEARRNFSYSLAS